MSEYVQNTVQGVGAIHTPNTAYNALHFMMEQAVKGLVCTAIPVRVDAVEPQPTPNEPNNVGYLSATPLITQRDGQGQSLTPTSIPKMPYCRIQGGIAAVVVDPIPGDIGLAVFAQQDISTLGTATDAPQQPGSFRCFDMADGIYIGGILNKKPEIWLELNQNKEATLHAPVKVTVNTTDCVVNASATTVVNADASATVNTQRAEINAQATTTVNTPYMEINAPLTRCNGALEVRDYLAWGWYGTGLNGGRARIINGLDVLRGLSVGGGQINNGGLINSGGLLNDGGLDNEGGITNSGAHTTSNGVVLEDHLHDGVMVGSGISGKPQVTTSDKPAANPTDKWERSFDQYKKIWLGTKPDDMTELLLCLPEIAQSMAGKAGSANDAQGWLYLESMFHKWFSGTSSKKGPEGEPLWVEWDWIMTYERVREKYHAFTDPRSETAPHIYNEAACNRLGDILCENGYMQKGDNEFDFIDTDWTTWQRNYHTLIGVPSALDIDGLMAAMGAFTLRALAKGRVKYLGDDKYQVSIDEIAVFVHDKFQFEREIIPAKEWLGQWSCELKSMVRFSAPDGDEAYYTGVWNNDFNKFRDDFGNGQDFWVFSQPHRVENFKGTSYEYTCKKKSLLTSCITGPLRPLL